MSLFTASLNSGSNGNCYYIGNENEAVLIDAGISCREIEQRMQVLGLCIDKLKAVIVSHEHTDHIKGVSVLAHKYQLPVYITSATFRNARMKLKSHLVQSFGPLDCIQIGDLAILPFPKCHDAADPYSFTVRCKDIRVGIFTDIGTPCEQLTHHFSQCNAAYLEANYDEHMLDKGNYPYYLKNRIKGGKGHLSNKQALSLFLTHRPSFMSHLFLSHLSRNNNCPKLVQELFDTNSNGVKMIVAGRYEQTDVYNITHSMNTFPLVTTRKPAAQLQFQFPSF